VALRSRVNRQRVPHWRLIRVRFALWTIAPAFDCSLQFDRQGDEQGTANKARLDAAQFDIVHGRLPSVHFSPPSLSQSCFVLSDRCPTRAIVRFVRCHLFGCHELKVMDAAVARTTRERD
jgi:hypothetical protein